MRIKLIDAQKVLGIASGIQQVLIILNTFFGKMAFCLSSWNTGRYHLGQQISVGAGLTLVGKGLWKGVGWVLLLVFCNFWLGRGGDLKRKQQSWLPGGSFSRWTLLGKVMTGREVHLCWQVGSWGF